MAIELIVVVGGEAWKGEPSELIDIFVGEIRRNNERGLFYARHGAHERATASYARAQEYSRAISQIMDAVIAKSIGGR